MRGRIIVFITHLLLASCVLAEVTVLKQVQTIYDKSPKLRIRGTGFDADDHDIHLELGVENSPALKVDRDYLISKDADNDGLILKLLGNRKWVDMTTRNPPVALILSSLTFGRGSTKNLLIEPVIVAQVLAAPSINESSLVIYSTLTKELRISGTGFMGAKKVDLYFSPPLYKEVVYVDVTSYPLKTDQIVLSLVHGYEWREEPGPLTILGLDTGGGPVKLGDKGVKIGDVVLDQNSVNLFIQSTADQQLIYHDQATIMISGSGFNPVGNTLRWSNGLLGNNVNYTTLSTSESAITLRLTPGSYWRRNMDNLPGALTLLAVNTGEGFVAVGPTNSGKGRDVAMVFERPSVYSDNKKLYRTHSHEFHIKGTGFPFAVSGYKPLLKFSPELVAGIDYTVRVVSRTEMEITLVDGRAWRSEPGPLLITSINTRGDEAGWVSLGGEGAHVAEIVEDIDAVTTAGVEVFPMGVKVYQSALNQKIQITGTGFKEGMSFVFEPAMTLNTDYDMDVETKNKITLRLRANKKWRADPGFIIAKSVKVDGKTYNLAGTEGIRVATVLPDSEIDNVSVSAPHDQSVTNAAKENDDDVVAISFRFKTLVRLAVLGLVLLGLLAVRYCRRKQRNRKQASLWRSSVKNSVFCTHRASSLHIRHQIKEDPPEPDPVKCIHKFCEHWGPDKYHCVDCAGVITDDEVIAEEDRLMDSIVDDSLSEDSVNRGVTIQFLVDFANAYNCWDMTTRDVRRRLVMPATRANRCRFVELPEMASFVGRAVTFVSHAWEAKFGDLVAALCDGHSDRNRIVWVDIFAVRQWPSHKPDFDFCAVVRQCKSFVIVCSSMQELDEKSADKSTARRISNAPPSVRAQIAFLRVWCLAEAHAATLYGCAIILKAGSHKREASGEVKFESNSKRLFTIQSLVDFKKAETTIPADKERLLAHVRSIQGSATAANEAIKGMITGAMIACDLPLMQSAACGDKGAFELMLRSSTSEYLTPASGCGYAELLKGLIAKGVDVNDSSKGRPLTAAAKGGHVACVELLIKSGADLAATDSTGGIALLSAASGGHTRCVELLINSGSDVDAVNLTKNTALMFAARFGHVACVELLIKSGSKMSAVNGRGTTALMSAASGGHTRCVELLVQSWADVNQKDASGWTALMLAAKSGHASCVELLVNNGADIAARDSKGMTALMWAAQGGHSACAELLLRLGADINARDFKRKNSLMLAAEGGHTECVEILKKSPAGGSGCVIA